MLCGPTVWSKRARQWSNRTGLPLLVKPTVKPMVKFMVKPVVKLMVKPVVKPTSTMVKPDPGAVKV